MIGSPSCPETDFALIHYNLAAKPWHYKDCRYGHYFWEYAAQTPGYDTLKAVLENFTEEELEKVWESFYRRDKSRDRKGTGLGLAITRQIVQLHSGSCYVKNTDTGVEFGIKLPN